MIKLWLACIVIVIVVGASIGGGYVLAAMAIDSSQHRWCQTLDLLTSNPVPRPVNPKSNPSRENAYTFYINLKSLERDFKC